MLSLRGRLAEPGRHAARCRLIRDVLGPAAAAHDLSAGPWQAFAYFTPEGRCIANVDAAVLPLVVDGTTRRAGAIRSVAVDPAWRGRGLFRTLMTAALAWCEARSPGPALLYTEEPDLYRRFGFHPLPQHGFVGDPPRPRPTAMARPLRRDEDDIARLRLLLARRAPVSRQCALLIDAPLFEANLAADADLEIAYAAAHDAAIVYELDGDLLTLVDIVAPAVPDTAAIIGALGASPRRIKTLFPPDTLSWQGAPVVEDTGLMARGVIPAAMQSPFMFPPTSEF